MSKARTRARRLAVQGLYEWQASGNDPRDILNIMLVNPVNKNADLEYLRELMRDIPNQSTQLDASLEPYLDRPLDEIDMVERAVLRVSAYELSTRLDIPYRVVINEGVELAKVFGADQGHKFVNGILDKLAADLRPDEVRQRRS